MTLFLMKLVAAMLSSNQIKIDRFQSDKAYELSKNLLQQSGDIKNFVFSLLFILSFCNDHNLQWFGQIVPWFNQIISIVVTF